MEWSLNLDPAATVRRYFRKESVDKINQIFNFTFIYRTEQMIFLLRKARP